MPVLTPKGPSLPVEILQAREEDRLVLFCGAGISVPAGLPLFSGLVEQVRGKVPVPSDSALEAAIANQEYDRALNLIEERAIPGAMRRAVIECLQGPADLTSPDDPRVVLHRDLLDIATTKSGTRLVTTNFDPLFSIARPELLLDAAPKLPVPKAYRWERLVHLHGSVREPGPDGRNLVLTSADFGTAYLVERWASRFVSELFWHFLVLFIGYSVDDPVMRYLVDALAAERRRDETIHGAFAFAPNDPAVVDRHTAWQTKGLVPIFYEAGSDDHHLLYATVHEWAGLCREGLVSRRKLALDRASAAPAHPGEDDARLMVWALSEESGTVANAFAGHDPLPTIGWLKIFEDSDELPGGLNLLSLPSGSIRHHFSQQDYQTALKRLPAPLADRGSGTAGPKALSPVSQALARWLARHLGEELLLDWVLQRGGVLHPEFRDAIRNQLGKAPDVPPGLTAVWKVLSSEVYAERAALRKPRLTSLWDKRRDAWDAIDREEILRLLSPAPRLRLARKERKELRALALDSEGEPVGDSVASPADFVGVKMELAGDWEARQILDALQASLQQGADLGKFPEDFTDLLRETLDWFSALGVEDGIWGPDHHVASVVDREKLKQRRHFDPWLGLLDLCRETALLLAQKDVRRTGALLQVWCSSRYLCSSGLRFMLSRNRRDSLPHQL